MTSVMPAPSSLPVLPRTRPERRMRSIGLLQSVESQTVRNELIFGRERLLRSISSVPHSLKMDHVRSYREMIRKNPWPNVRLDSDISGFLDDYYKAAIVYVKSGFELLQSFPWTDDPISFRPQYQLSLASEALRGQFGKRSDTGLDSRLEEGSSEIERLLGTFLAAQELDETIQSLCCPTPPCLSAEATLLNDFVEVRSVFVSKPSIGQVTSLTGDSEEIVWRFLRRHCRWSVAQMWFYYEQFEGPVFEAAVLSAEKTRAAQSEKRQQTILKLAATLPAAVFAQVMNVADDLTNLNHINLALEPSFSFKGGPGLLHGMAFRHGSRLGLHGSIPQKDISATKWQLLETKDP